MNRILIDYRKLPHDVASLLIELYPHGYGDEDLIVLKKPNGEIIEAVEVKTNDTIYLVKISKSLANFISNFEETIEILGQAMDPWGKPFKSLRGALKSLRKAMKSWRNH